MRDSVLAPATAERDPAADSCTMGGGGGGGDGVVAIVTGTADINLASTTGGDPAASPANAGTG